MPFWGLGFKMRIKSFSSEAQGGAEVLIVEFKMASDRQRHVISIKE
jgi:hypothetical protein